MALVDGTDVGFCEEAPGDAPSGSGTDVVDTFAWGSRFQSPAGAETVTEIGWYCNNATEAANFEVGIYDDEGNPGQPVNVVGALSQTNAKGTTAGWKRVTGLNITISAETIYWICLQVDNTATATQTIYGGSADEDWRQTYTSNQTELSDPFPEQTGSYWKNVDAFYALVPGEAPTGTNTQINIGDVWKDIETAQINIGDSWKAVAGMEINIGDVWKTIY